MDEKISVKRGYTTNSDPVKAINELLNQISQDRNDLMMFFISPNYYLQTIEQSLNHIQTKNIVGVTTAGEISNDGLVVNSITGFSLKSDYLAFHIYDINDLETFSIKDSQRVAREIIHNLKFNTYLNPRKIFGILLIDGLSAKEEQIVSVLANTFNNIPIVGGSAGDNLNFIKTHIYLNYLFKSNRAAFIIVESELPFEIIKTHHFVPTNKILKITKAKPSARLVYEINDEPAAIYYSKLINVPKEELAPKYFSKNPLIENYYGDWYIREILQANADDSLRFACVVEENRFYNLGKPGNIIKNLDDKFREVERKIGRIDFLLGFDCSFRRVEIEGSQSEEEYNNVLKKYNVVGFSTYGEQCNSLHMNHTFTGVAISGA
ncbi:MAG: FIST C-terminal domain-containing protein [Candidatus Kapabacteria bacterium]|nr:FIST C-terminal domain-containing protein [Candidatus Kapabacteria bacterium]